MWCYSKGTDVALIVHGEEGSLQTHFLPFLWSTRCAPHDDRELVRQEQLMDDVKQTCSILRKGIPSLVGISFKRGCPGRRLSRYVPINVLISRAAPPLQLVVLLSARLQQQRIVLLHLPPLVQSVAPNQAGWQFQQRAEFFVRLLVTQQLTAATLATWHHVLLVLDPSRDRLTRFPETSVEPSRNRRSTKGTRTSGWRLGGRKRNSPPPSFRVQKRGPSLFRLVLKRRP